MGRLCGVTVLADGEGLEVSRPDGETATFPSRRGTRFSGPEGTLSFDVVRGRMTMTMVSPAVNAQKQD